MTDPLDILDRAHAASTGGEWRVHFNPRFWVLLPEDGVTPDDKDANRDANAAFIVAAHNLWPAVAEELRLLREVAHLVEMHACCDGDDAQHTHEIHLALAQLDAARGKVTT